MFSRLQFKQDAKLILSRRYWESFLVCIIVSLLMGIIDKGFSPISPESLRQLINDPGITIAILRRAFVRASVTSIILGLAAIFFISGPLQVGQARFFLRQRVYDERVRTLFSAFRPGYLKVCAAMMLKDLLVTLGLLLLIVPGILLSLAYEMVPFIMAENPKISPIAALRLSLRMTDGYKWEIFVLKLSFIGWRIVGLLCCGIGGLFLSPYIMATSAEMYVFLRNDAITSCRINSEELVSARKPDSGVA